MDIDPLQAYRVRDWFALEGDKTFRLDYDLGPDSVVVDDGGFEGNFAAAIHARYGCTVHVFEPIASYCDFMARRFNSNPKIKVYPYGLGAKDEVLRFNLSGDASSSFKEGEKAVEAPIRSVVSVFAELGLSSVDLMKINVEGAEYETLDALVSSGLINRIRDLQVQFHDFVPDARAKVIKARESLKPTHAPTYMFSFVWENWRKIENGMEADLRQRLFVTTDHLRETLHTREREIDELRLKTHWVDLAWQAETKALRKEIDELRQTPNLARRVLTRLKGWLPR